MPRPACPPLVVEEIFSADGSKSALTCGVGGSGGALVEALAAEIARLLESGELHIVDGRIIPAQPRAHETHPPTH